MFQCQGAGCGRVTQLEVAPGEAASLGKVSGLEDCRGRRGLWSS